MFVYIDGYNLYYGMCQQFQGKYKWLDLQALAESFLESGMELVRVKYFTSRTTKDDGSEKRQAIYLRALKAHCNKLDIIYGKFQPKDKTCPNCNEIYRTYEEKQTDVNIACEMLKDAWLDRYDIAYLVSGDSDLVPPIKIIQAQDKRVVVAFPPQRKSKELSEMATAWLVVGVQKFRKHQLPDSVGSLTRPKDWK